MKAERTQRDSFLGRIWREEAGGMAGLGAAYAQRRVYPGTAPE
jgi:hypothetical protein